MTPLLLRERRVVLLLDESTERERAIRAVVRAEGLPVAVTSTAAAAVDAVHARDAALILADLRLGAETIELVRRDDTPPVVALWSGQPAELLADLLAARDVCIATLEAPDLRTVMAHARANTVALSESVQPAVVAALTQRLRAGALADPIAARERARRRFAAPGALRAVYQPIADLRSRRRIGYLALTRFTGAPDQDTALRFAEAREHGLGQELELAAAATALAQVDRVPAGELLFLKLTCPSVASGAVDDLLTERQTTITVLELTGHADLLDRDAFYRAVERLRARGVQFAVDETGAGFGALDFVLDLAPSYVRLAGGLTRDIHTDRTRRALALAVTSFASHLGAHVIADRIESEQEEQALRRLGVGLGLGFHIGHPGELPPLPPAAELAGATLTGEEAVEPSALVWPPARSSRMRVSPRSRYAFTDAAPAVLRELSERLDTSALYIAYVDRDARLVRVVDAPERGEFEPGRTFPLDDALDAAVLSEQVPQFADSRSWSEDAVPAAVRELGADGWASVPFAGRRGSPFAALTVLEPLDDDELELLADGAAILRDALQSQHGEQYADAEVELRDVSWRDQATGVLNAARFHELLDAAGGSADAYVVHLRLGNYQALASRMGQTVADLVRKDVARALARHAEGMDAIARVGSSTFGCILYGRRAGEVEYFCEAVGDDVAAAARRRGATTELAVGTARFGLGGMDAHASWRDAGERALLIR